MQSLRSMYFFIYFDIPFTLQDRNQNPVKPLKLSVFRSYFSRLAVNCFEKRLHLRYSKGYEATNYFRKTLHLRCMTGFRMHLSSCFK